MLIFCALWKIKYFLINVLQIEWNGVPFILLSFSYKYEYVDCNKTAVIVRYRQRSILNRNKSIGNIWGIKRVWKFTKRKRTTQVHIIRDKSTLAGSLHIYTTNQISLFLSFSLEIYSSEVIIYIYPEYCVRD